MCIKIINSGSEVNYDSTIPLEEQIKSSKKIVVNYEQKDPDVDKFLSEIERICNTGVSTKFSVEIVHNNYIKGAKAGKQVKRLMKDLKVNEAIKLLVNLQSMTDRGLEELALYCKER